MNPPALDRRYPLAFASLVLCAACESKPSPADAALPVATPVMIDAGPPVSPPQAHRDLGLLVVAEGADPRDVEALRSWMKRALHPVELQVVASPSSLEAIFDATKKVSAELKPPGRVWLGFVGTVTKGNDGVPLLKPTAQLQLGISDWLGHAAAEDTDSLLLIDGVRAKGQDLRFELLAFDRPDAAVLAGLHAQETAPSPFVSTLSSALTNRADTNHDGRITGLEALRYLREIAPPTLDVQFASRGVAGTDESPLVGPRRR